MKCENCIFYCICKEWDSIKFNSNKCDSRNVIDKWFERFFNYKDQTGANTMTFINTPLII